MELLGASLPVVKKTVPLDSTKDQEQEQNNSGDVRNLIIVTGFGPFAGHECANASWEAVRLLPDILQHHHSNYILKKQHIPTAYEAVDEVIPEIWSQKPILVIHCGVNGQADCIYVETNACNNNFKRADVNGKVLPNCTAILCNNNNDKCHRLECGLNVEEIVNKTACNCILTKDGNNIIEKPQEVVKISHDTGDYLCAYIYLKSLDINAKRTLFIHVPCIDKPFSSAQTSDVILNIIKCCLEQLTTATESAVETEQPL